MLDVGGAGGGSSHTAIARVPDDVSRLLGRLAEDYGLVACVSGRPALDARAVVGVDGITYIGNHGLERLGPGGSSPVPLFADADPGPPPSLALDHADLAASGLRVEDKGLIMCSNTTPALGAAPYPPLPPAAKY